VWNDVTVVDVSKALEPRAATTAWVEEHEVVARLAVSEVEPG
jgi:hypothetical protein